MRRISLVLILALLLVFVISKLLEEGHVHLSQAVWTKSTHQSIQSFLGNTCFILSFVQSFFIFQVVRDYISSARRATCLTFGHRGRRKKLGWLMSHLFFWCPLGPCSLA